MPLLQDNWHGGDWTGEVTNVAGLNLPFWAKILSFDGVKFYSWAEYYPDITAAFVALPGGRSGSVTLQPAYEANRNAVTLNSFVLLRRAYYDPVYDWTFVVVGTATSTAGATTITVQNLDGSGTTTNVTEIDTDQATGLVSSTLAPGKAKIRIVWSNTNPTPTPFFPPTADPTGGSGGTITVPANTTKILFTPAGTETIAGIAAGSDGQLLYLINKGPGIVKLQNSATVATPLGVDYLMQPGCEIQLEYLSSFGKWVFAHPTLGAGSLPNPEYGCELLLPGTGVTITPNGDGSATISAPAADGGGADLHGWHHSGQWYSWFLCKENGQIFPTDGKIWVTPFLTTQKLLVTQAIGVAAANGGVGSHNLRLGLYRNTSPSNLYPSTLLFDSGAINIGPGPMGARTAAMALNLAPGLYWMALLDDSSTLAYNNLATQRDYGIIGSGSIPLGGLSSNLNFWVTGAFAFGALPDPFPGGASAQNGGFDIWIQVA